MDVWTLPGLPVNEEELTIAIHLRDRLQLGSLVALQREAMAALCRQHRDILEGEGIQYPQRGVWEPEAPRMEARRIRGTSRSVEDRRPVPPRQAPVPGRAPAASGADPAAPPTPPAAATPPPDSPA